MLFFAAALSPWAAAEAAWGPAGCPPLGPVGPPAFAPLQRPVIPTFTIGKPCSNLCVCGCNANGACPCKGLPAPPRKPVGKKPEQLVVAEEPSVNYGVDLSKLGGGERYLLGGREVSRARAIQAVTLDDDSAKLRLTVIGSESDCKRALDGLPADLRAAWSVTDYRPDHWHVEPGFVKTGTPTIYLQKPDGSVLWRQDEYLTAADWEAVRKADPNYKPDRDPGPKKPDTPKPPDPSPPAPATTPVWVLVALGLILLAGVVYKRRES